MILFGKETLVILADPNADDGDRDDDPPNQRGVLRRSSQEVVFGQGIGAGLSASQRTSDFRY